MERVKVQRIEIIEPAKDLYDLEVADNNNFVADNILVHNCHLTAANGYTRFITKLNMKYKIGLTATPTRKDKKEFLLQWTIGPVVVKGKANSLKPTVEINYTNFKPKGAFRGRAAYTYANQWLGQNKDRKKAIVKQIFADLRADPKHSIMIPVLFVNQARNLADLINKQALFNNQNKGEKWPENMAVAYYDDKKKQQSALLDAARANKETRVLIGIRKMFKVGIDVPAWTHMYLTFPMNNQEDFFQMTQRICTPYEGKPKPVLRMYVDPIPLSEGCFIATYHHIQHYKYVISKESSAAVKKIFESRKPKKDDTGEW